MKQDGPPRRPGVTAALAIAVLLLAAAVPLRAQVRDTTRIRADTLGADTLQTPQDTTPPNVLVPLASRLAVTDFASAVWTWDRDALLLEGAVTLLDLVARVPGVTTLRSGVFLQPEAATLFGGGGARTVVELDGFILDPLVSPSLDLSTIELTHLDQVRIERRADALVIRLRSDAPRDYRPYSRIEAGVGEPSANLFRGVLLAPRFLFGPIGVAVERLELEGAGRPQPADMFSGWIRWGWLSEARGIEVEARSNRLRREEGSPRPLDLDRTDIVVRLRNRFVAGLVAEAFAARSDVDVRDRQAGVADSLRFLMKRSLVQAGARLGGQVSAGDAELAVRWREDPAMPRLEVDGAIEGRTGSWLSLALAATRQSWRDGTSATSWRAQVTARPIGPVRVFGEYAGGSRGAPLLPDTGRFHVGERSVLRAGGEVSLGGLTAGGAMVRVETDSIVTFGLPSDTVQAVLPGGDVSGWESWGRVPLFRDWLYAYGSYTIFTGGTRWTYLPASQLQATLEVHSVPLPSGNLELRGRFEAFRRGVMLGPPAAVAQPGVDIPARTLLNAYFQIRIIDVRIFVRFDDMLGQDIEDVTGLFIQGPRIVYGVKWNFWN